MNKCIFKYIVLFLSLHCIYVECSAQNKNIDSTKSIYTDSTKSNFTDSTKSKRTDTLISNKENKNSKKSDSNTSLNNKLRIPANAVAEPIIQKPIETSFWGVRLNNYDFYTANAIQQQSLSNTLQKKDWNPFNTMPTAVGIIHVKRLAEHADFYGGLEFGNIFKPSYINNKLVTADKKDYISVDVNLNTKLFSSKHILTPFFSVGIAVAYYNYSNFEAYIPLGIGVQIKIKKDVFMNVNFADKVKVTEFAFPHFNYGISMYSPLHKIKFKTKEKVIKIPPKPPKDTDKDGIIDSLDKCPLVFGFKRYQGCPIPDRDKDGLNDEEDKCPTIPGLKRYKGCPIPDFDGDGINDELDSCPTIPGYARYKGCPIPDTDGDLVNDEDDLCVTVKGLVELFGCPDYSSTLSKLGGKILFKYGSPILEDTAALFLDKIYNIIKNTPYYLLVITGHTDNISTRKFNLKLSIKRAESVKNYLVKKGLPAKTISVVGQAFDFPIAPNDSEKNRALNRRIEFKLLNSNKESF